MGEEELDAFQNKNFGLFKAETDTIPDKVIKKKRNMDRREQ
jgi:hypothetical protein